MVEFNKDAPQEEAVKGSDLKRIILPETMSQHFPLGRRYDGREIRWDADLTAMFTRQLTDIITQTYDVEYPELKARQLIPVDNRFNTASMAFTWKQFDKFSPLAQVIDDYADDFPNADVAGKEFTGQFRSLGNSYQYSVQDMRAAAMAGIPLDAKKAEAARFAMESKLEDLAATGYVVGSTVVLPGIVGANSDVPLITANGTAISSLATGSPLALTAGFGNWNNGSTTLAQIMSDVNGMQNQVFSATKGIHMPDTMVLPTTLFSFLSTTQRSLTFTDDTVIQYILKSSPWLKSIEFWPRLDTAAASGTGKGRVWMYKKDPRLLALNISQEFEQFPPQILNMVFKIPCHMRVGGTVYRYPLSGVFLDGAAV